MRLFARARSGGRSRGGMHRFERMRMTRMPPLPAEREELDPSRSVTCRAQRGKWCAQWGKSEGKKSRLCAHSPRGQCRPGQFGHGGSHGDALQSSIVCRHAELGYQKEPDRTRSSFEVKTGRVPHLDPIGSACDPLPGPERARGVNFGRTEEGDSSRPQPVTVTSGETQGIINSPNITLIDLTPSFATCQTTTAVWSDRLRSRSAVDHVI